MIFEEVINELEMLGNERTKKIHIGNGAHEPLFGVAMGAAEAGRKLGFKKKAVCC